MLQNDHALFRSIFGQASLGIVTADPELRLAHCNRAFCAMLGYRHEEIAGLGMVEVVSPQDMASIERSTGEHDFQGEWQFRRKDGSFFTGAVVSCKSPDGWLQAIVLDIAEANRIEPVSSAQENKDRYFSELEKRLREAPTAREAVRTACEAIGQELGAAFAGIGEFDPHSRHTVVDSAWTASGEPTALHGRHEHFAASRIADHVTAGVAIVEDVLTDHCLAGDEGAQLTYRTVGARSSIAVPLIREGHRSAVLFVADKASRAWTEAEIALAQETLERVWQAVERARAEEELRQTTERFQLALKGSPVTLFCQDLDLRYTWISNTPYASGPSLGKLPGDVFERADDAAASEAIKREVIRSGRNQRQEFAVQSDSGERLYDLLVDPLRDADGRIAGVRCAAIDITERKRAEAALRESRARQSFLLALNDEFRLTSDPMKIKAAASRLLGHKLAAGQVAYADIDEAGGHAIISRDWNDGTIPSNAAIHKIEDFGAFLEDLKRGQTIVISDVHDDPRTSMPEAVAAFEHVSVAAFLNVPLVKDERLVAVLAVHMKSPRAWTREDVTLAQEVAERTWEAVERARAEQALRESEERLRFSMKGAGAGAWQWNVLATDLVWSAECYGLHGVDPKLGKPGYENWLRCVHPDDRASVERAVFDAIIRGSREYRADYRVVLPSGEVRRLEAVGKVDYAAGGTPARMAGIILDITERKRAEEALREKEEWLRLAVKSSGAAVWQWDISKDEHVWSPESYKLHGRDPELGPPNYEGWLHCLHPDDRASAEKAAFDAVEKRSPEYRMEYRVLLPTGEVRWLDALGRVDYAADGTPVRMSRINIDITGRKRAEQALRQSEESLRLALKGSGAAPWQWNISTNEMIASLEGYEIHGCPDMFGQRTTYEDWAECLHPEDRARAEKEVIDTFEKRSAEYTNEYRIALLSGGVRWVNVLGKVDYAADGTRISLDITERKRTEEALRQAEKLQRQKCQELETLLAAIPVPVFIAEDADCTRMTGNRAAYDLLRIPQNISLSKSAAAEQAPDNFNVFSKNRQLSPDELPIQRAAAGKFTVLAEELEICFVEGDSKCILVNALPLFDDVGEVRGAIGVFIDVTELKRTEAALRESEERLRFALDAANAGTWEGVPETGEFTASDRALALHGAPPGTPMSHEKAMEAIHPEDRSRVEKAVRQSLETGKPYRAEMRMPLPDGSIRWVEACGEPRLVSGKRVISGLLQDITERKRAEMALRESEERLRFALEIADAGTWEAVLETGEFTASDRALAMHGAPPGTPMSLEKAMGVVHPDDRQRAIEAGLQARNGKAFRVEFRTLAPDGSIRWVELSGEPRTVSGRQVVSGLLQDITERKRAEIALRESEERLRFALEAANAGSWESVPETGEFKPSDRALAIHGAPPGTLMSFEKVLEAVHPEDRERAKEAAFYTLGTKRVEFRIPTPDGAIRWLESWGEPRFVSGRRVISGLLQDITERKRAELALRENEELLRCIIEHAPVPIILSREDRKILLINPALTALTGYTSADIPTRNEWENLAYREHAQEVRDTLHIAFESGIPLDRPELCVYTRWGEKRVWSVRTAPAGRDSSGQRLLVSVALDITEHRKSAEEARASRSKLEAALASMTDALFISDAEGHFTHFNEAFAKFHRFKSREDCAGTFAEYPPFLEFFRPSGESLPQEEWPSRRALRGETGMLCEYIIKQRGGDSYVGSYNFAPIRDSGGEITGAVVTARDITEQKRAVNRLRESEARLSSIIDSAADSIIVIDEKGKVQSANPASLDILGYSPEDLIGQNINILMPPQLQAGHDHYLARFSGRAKLKEVEARRKNGSTIPLDLAVAEWQDGEGRRFFTGILRDLSERKENEEALANARRLEAVGQLAGGVAHDFNNLLAVIAGNLELAEDGITDEATRALIRRALDAAEKGSGLNRRLLSLARKRTLKPQRLTLNSRVEETAKLLTSILGEHIAVSTDLTADPWVTVADPGEIDSAILNIAANARDAMPNGGRIAVATSNVTLDAAMAAGLHPCARPGEFVCLAIADDGVGMPEEILRKATQPFFTTKGQGSGTGLGLTSVVSFAKQTGGFATVESAPGRGCAVSLYLPRGVEKLPVWEAARRSEVPLGKGERVLVVEDNDQVRDVTVKRIASLGYAVTEARTGPEAIQLLQSREPVQLVLSDIVMPGGMTGYDVARWLASNMPEIKVLLCSGYNEGDRRGDAQGAIRDITVLGKPYTREQLAGALTNALAARRRVPEKAR